MCLQGWRVPGNALAGFNIGLDSPSCALGLESPRCCLNDCSSFDWIASSFSFDWIASHVLQGRAKENEE